MASCARCFEPIEETDKVAESPCCDQKYHSRCLINYIGLIIYSNSHVHCACGELLYEHIEYLSDQQSNTDNLDSMLERPGMQEDLQHLKQKLKQERVAYKEVTKLITSESNRFHQSAKELYTIIQSQKKSIIDGIRSSDTYRRYQSVKKSMTLYYHRLKAKHGVNSRTICDLLPGIRGGYYSNITYYLRRRFRDKNT